MHTPLPALICRTAVWMGAASGGGLGCAGSPIKHSDQKPGAVRTNASVVEFQ
jgi:hypothetical protein